MSEQIRIAELVFEIETNGSDGKFKSADELAKKALALSSIRKSEDGSLTKMHPLEDGSTIIRVEMHDLIMDIPDAINTSSND